MRSPLGALVARPWFDRVALRFIARRFLPLSRAWAAATIAEGSVERFLAEVPLADPGPRLHRRLAPVLDRVNTIARFHAPGKNLKRCPVSAGKPLM